MKRIAYTLAIAVTLFLVAFASEANGAPTTTTAASDSSFVHVTVPSAGITVGYPGSWTVTKYSGLSKAARKKIAKLNPKLADQVQSAPQNAKLYAIDLTHPESFADNINVIVEESGGFPASLSDFRQVVTSGYQSLGATIANASASTIGGKKSYTAVAVLPLKVDVNTTVNAYVTQLFVPKGDGSAVVTITTTDDDPGHALAQRIAASIKGAH